MSKTFSILITVDTKGNITSKAWEKKDSQVGINEFTKARESGKEAYFYQHPTPDKRCKSAVDTASLKSMISTGEVFVSKKVVEVQEVEQVVQEVKRGKKASSLDGAIDLE